MKTSKTNREWVVRLPGVVEVICNEEIRMIGMKLVDPIKLDRVKQPEDEEDVEDLPMESLIRYLYKPGEEQDDNRYRHTDPIWSVDTYDIDQIQSDKNQPFLYTLQEMDPERTFTREHLQVIPLVTKDL